jgi:hypothetical protein
VYDPRVVSNDGRLFFNAIDGLVPCTTEASCKAGPTPQPAIYQAPASATFNGPGNVAPEAQKPAVKVTKKKAAKCPKGKKRDKKGRCVKKPKKRGKR